MTVTVPEAVTRVTDETHARAVLALLVRTHGLPVAADGITWRPAFFGDIIQQTVSAALWVHVASIADVQQWAAVLGAEIRNDDSIIDARDKPGAWIAWRERTVHVDEWLPGVRLWVQWRESRLVPAPRRARKAATR